jgi:FkbH-like protein
MQRHPTLGWAPKKFRDDAWHETLDAALAEGRIVAARAFLRKIDGKTVEDLKKIRVAVLRTFSLELSHELLALAFLRWGVAVEFHWFDFNAFESELVDSESALRKSHRESPFDFVLLAWRLKDWLPEAWMNPTSASAIAASAASRARIEKVLGTALEIAPTVAYPLNDHPADASTPSMRFAQDALISEHHATLLKWVMKNPARATMVDLKHIAFDRKSEAHAHQPFSSAGQVSQALALARACAPWITAASKVLVLDADNTLWGGIIGEDGLKGIHLGHDFPGNLYRELHARARSLKEQGVLLCLASKNNAAAVEEVFATNSDLPLKLTDFAVRKVNWEDKAIGLQAMAKELNLGLGSFVFLDDSSFERAQVRTMLPEVRVPETPDILAMLDYLENGCDFELLPATEEDRNRVLDYEAKKLREDLESNSTSREDFLKSLELVANCAAWDTDSLPRVAQLLQKTNQFNLTTRRPTLGQVESYYQAEDWAGWTLKTRDRFADQGLVGCAIARRIDSRNWEIDSLLLSCRALSRGFETALLFTVLAQLKARGARRVRAKYVPSGKNVQVSSFYANHGATLLSETTDGSDYEFDLEGSSSWMIFPSWIKLQDEKET